VGERLPAATLTKPFMRPSSPSEEGVVGGVLAVTQHLVKNFPADGDSRNELPNQPVVL